MGSVALGTAEQSIHAVYFFSVTDRSLPAAFSCYSPNVSSGRFLPSQ